jgi:hypothetical protein
VDSNFKISQISENKFSERAHVLNFQKEKFNCKLTMTETLLKIILYFDVFSYPLKKDEILHYAGIGEDQKAEASTVLDFLCRKGFLNYANGFYFIGDQGKVARREAGNAKARQRMNTAYRFSRIISWFPFVRAVMLSGSISKGFMAERDDIDYFIVVHPGRLWITRTLLTIFKKVFLLNSYRNFCINYFVDSDHLEIKERNRFTATELVFLVPVYNRSVYKEILAVNEWVKCYYPVFFQLNNNCFDGEPFLKRWVEKLLSKRYFDRIENRIFEKSKVFVRKKFMHMDEKAFDKSFCFQKYELRYFPNRQQFQILKIYTKQIQRFEDQTGIKLSGTTQFAI